MPLIMGSATAEAGNWWQLDIACEQEARAAPLWLCERRLQRDIGSVNLVWDTNAQSGLGSAFCGNGVVGLACTPVGWAGHWGWTVDSGLEKEMPITLNGELTGPLGGFGWHLRWDQGSPRKLCFERVQVGANTQLLISLAYPTSSVSAASFTVKANAPSWCSTSWGDSCSQTFSQVTSIGAVRASAGNVWHYDSAGGLFYLRIVQPPKDNTGSPNWSLTGGRIPSFTRDGITIERYPWCHASHRCFTFAPIAHSASLPLHLLQAHRDVH